MNGWERIFYSACGGKTSRRRVRVRSHPFNPFHPFSNPVALGRRPQMHKVHKTSCPSHRRGIKNEQRSCLLRKLPKIPLNDCVICVKNPKYVDIAFGVPIYLKQALKHQPPAPAPSPRPDPAQPHFFHPQKQNWLGRRRRRQFLWPVRAPYCLRVIFCPLPMIC